VTSCNGCPDETDRWMLREVGNRGREVEQRFLVQHYRGMPPTMLRCAIEKFSYHERLAFLRNGTMTDLI